TWCVTCKAQQRAFEQMKADADLPLTILVADFDTEHALMRQLQVRDRSTLIVYRGATERSRLSFETDPAKLKAALQTALPK
ncbi:MAG: thioredoxin family protein, partial [Leptothrix sp. (in: b-proteobacteria)]